jgi:putative membrane protein
MGVVWGFLIALIVSAIVIWIVGKLGLGMTVSGFGGAIIAALVIAIVAAVVSWLLGLLGISLRCPSHSR